MLVLVRHNLSDTSAARAYHMDIVHGRVMYQNLQKRITMMILFNLSTFALFVFPKAGLT